MKKTIEPWTVFKCKSCEKEYILVDGCSCGDKESEKIIKKHLGGFDGFKKFKRSI